ncbi:uncharacterized protein EV154DRAFT_399960, partial [Mucor mucedo]|uniref:uncharacterized protein n=1 Tax=Mucor mucedo TaxID=29922 RepID=UPI00222034BE
VEPENLTPILIEVQHEVNDEFMSREITYCLSFKKEYGQSAILLIIAIKAVTDDVKLKFANLNHDQDYLDVHDSGFWAKKCQILSATSIQSHLKEIPLQKLVALGHFFIQQKRCILSLDKKYDPTIQLLYQIAKEKFEDECPVEEEKLAVIQDLCYKGKTRFRKIIDCIENNEPTEKIMQHALNGECFFMHQARKFDEKQRELTPIEDTPDVSSLTTTTYHNNSLAMDDNTFVENFIANKTGGMSWKRCYEEGKEKGFFSNYTTWKSLKSAHNRKS